MKIPFYTAIGPLLKKNKIFINKICSSSAFAFAPIYVGVLGFLGVILSLFDILRIVKCGPVLPRYLSRERLKSDKLVTAEAERDCKLICLVLSTEYYLFLLIGLLTENPIFFMPFLCLYTLIISLEIIIYATKLYLKGFTFEKRGLIMTVLMTYNWLSVLCAFARLMSCCDL
ncbi:hypothetical protein GWI33_008119 [Rhynchophorus ferrugineus]|uniref:Uncharacterized protein n=1 Tax=Rhynchophorus ferrugineus TaxID=354439 RepID=A0A834MG49_RHYFE|nr:hypothetical protein GWI33_008119 [Rhynchophorus ferrugineus]